MPRYVIVLEACNQKAIDDSHDAVRRSAEVRKAAVADFRNHHLPLTNMPDKRIIAADASGWTSGTDLYDTVLPLLGAPGWHGYSQDALVESMVFGEINAIEPPYTLRVHGTSNLPPDIAEDLRRLKEHVEDARIEFNVMFGRDVDVDVAILP